MGESTATRYARIDGQFRMHRGGYLESPQIAYETWGRLDDRGDNAVLIFTGLSPSAHATSSTENPASGWWEDMVGAGLPVDTDRFFVICVNSLGSCYGSTGPASVNPETGERYRLTFPTLTLEDVAVGARAVLRDLDIDRLHSVIGCSMGGMSGLAFCVRYPDVARAFLSISSATRALPFSIAVRSLQREMIWRDPLWDGGDYSDDSPPVLGQRMARKLGMITYRSAEEWDKRFGRERSASEGHPGNRFRGDFAVESYLEYQANRFVGEFDANCYLYLSRASDLFDFAEHGGSLEAAFNQLNLERAMVIGVRTDFLFPLHQQQALVEDLRRVVPDCELVELDCLKGHDSFLTEMDAFRPVVARFYAA